MIFILHSLPFPQRYILFSCISAFISTQRDNILPIRRYIKCLSPLRVGIKYSFSWNPSFCVPDHQHRIRTPIFVFSEIQKKFKINKKLVQVGCYYNVLFEIIGGTRYSVAVSLQ